MISLPDFFSGSGQAYAPVYAGKGRNLWQAKKGTD
jgi:hypothetical protein